MGYKRGNVAFGALAHWYTQPLGEKQPVVTHYS